MSTRRSFIAGCGLWLLQPPKCACAYDLRHNDVYGCTLTTSETDKILGTDTDTRLYITGNEPMIPRSGDRDFDLALAQTLAKISNILNVSPGFAYYDDYDGLNAYASAHARLSGADGTVLFGQRLLRRLMDARENPEVGVAAVCAHEFGHILQYKIGLDKKVGNGQPTVKRIELQADFFAGYFAGIKKRESPSFPAAVVAMSQYNAGDNMINQPSHHGTSDERAAATVRGFQTAYVEKKSLSDAIETSVNYVMSK
jgi:hypothetical protein